MSSRNGQRRGRPATTGIPFIRTHSPTPVPYNLNHPSISPWENQVPNQSSSGYDYNWLALPQRNAISGYTIPEGYGEYGMTDHSNGDHLPYQPSQTHSTASDSHSQTHTNFDAGSGRLYQGGRDGSLYGRPFYSDEASPSDLSDYHAAINPNPSYLSNVSQWENPGSSLQGKSLAVYFTSRSVLC
jgi:hypothetical protein